MTLDRIIQKNKNFSLNDKSFFIEYLLSEQNLHKDSIHSSLNKFKNENKIMVEQIYNKIADNIVDQNSKITARKNSAIAIENAIKLNKDNLSECLLLKLESSLLSKEPEIINISLVLIYYLD